MQKSSSFNDQRWSAGTTSSFVYHFFDWIALLEAPRDSRLTCSHFYEECERVEELPDGLTHLEERELLEKQQRQHHLSPGTAVRAVAVVTRNRYKDEQEGWGFEDLWHTDCGPSVEEFESEYASRKRIGKDEVLVED